MLSLAYFSLTVFITILCFNKTVPDPENKLYANVNIFFLNTAYVLL